MAPPKPQTDQLRKICLVVSTIVKRHQQVVTDTLKPGQADRLAVPQLHPLTAALGGIHAELVKLVLLSIQPPSTKKARGSAESEIVGALRPMLDNFYQRFVPTALAALQGTAPSVEADKGRDDALQGKYRLMPVILRKQLHVRVVTVFESVQRTLDIIPLICEGRGHIGQTGTRSAAEFEALESQAMQQTEVVKQEHERVKEFLDPSFSVGYLQAKVCELKGLVEDAIQELSSGSGDDGSDGFGDFDDFDGVDDFGDGNDASFNPKRKAAGTQSGSDDSDDDSDDAKGNADGELLNEMIETGLAVLPTMYDAAAEYLGRNGAALMAAEKSAANPIDALFSVLSKVQDLVDELAYAHYSEGTPAALRREMAKTAAAALDAIEMVSKDELSLRPVVDSLKQWKGGEESSS